PTDRRRLPAPQPPSGRAGPRPIPQAREPLSTRGLKPQTRHCTLSTVAAGFQHCPSPMPKPHFNSRCVTSISQRCGIPRGPARVGSRCHAQPSSCSTGQGSAHTPPTIWQKAPTGARHKRTSAHPEHDLHLLPIHRDLLDERANEIPASPPVGRLELRLHLHRELLQPPDDES